MSLNVDAVDSEIWEMYKKSEASFWTVEEVDLENDMCDWKSLDDNEKFFTKRVLVFFASADIVVADNVNLNFSREFEMLEVQFFYDFQTMIENIHSEMYSTLLCKYVDSFFFAQVPMREVEIYRGGVCACQLRFNVHWAQSVHKVPPQFERFRDTL